MTAPARWEPDAATLARGNALRGHFPYRNATAIAEGESSQRAIPPGTRAFAAWVRTWPGIAGAGTSRSPTKPATPGRVRDLHEEGRAVDAMVANPASPEGVAAGSALASYVVQHADDLGVQFVVWRGTSWGIERDPAWREYAGDNPHNDHVHVELTPDAAGSPAASSLDTASATRSSARWVPALIAGGAIAAAAYLLARRGREQGPVGR